MDARIEKAARQDDVYELARLAHAYPGLADELQGALTDVVVRLKTKGKSHELAHILTLPAREPEWPAVKIAIDGLAEMGPAAVQPLLSVSQSGAGPTKLRAAQALERVGETDRADALRAAVRTTEATSVSMVASVDPRWLTAAPPSSVDRSPALARAQAELSRLGFDTVSQEVGQIVAVRQKWYWDVMASKLTQVVFVWAVAALTESDLRSDFGRLREYALRLDPSRLPRGFQKGFAAIPVYLADQVDPGAQRLLAEKPSVGFGSIYFPAARDETTGAAHVTPNTAVVGRAFTPKLRFIAQRVVDPEHAPEREPVSVLMVVLGAFILIVFVLAIVGIVVSL